MATNPPPHVTESSDLIQIVLDDAAVDRLRLAAVGRGIEVEQLMVQLLHLASFRIDDVLGETNRANS